MRALHIKQIPIYLMLVGNMVTTVAGVNYIGSNCGLGTNAGINNPKGIAINNDNEIYFSDLATHSIRKIPLDGKYNY